MSKKFYSPIELMYTPKKDNDAVSKKFVEDLLSKKMKENCLVNTEGNLTGFTYSSADLTLTQDLGSEEPLTLNNIVVPVGSRVLVMGQTSLTENGIYVLEKQGVKAVAETYEKSDTGVLTVVADGTLTDATTEVELSTVQTFDATLIEGDKVNHIEAVTGVQAVLKRAEDFDDSSDVATGTIVNVTSINAQFTLTTEEPIIIDTSNIVFAKSSADDDTAKVFEGEIVVVDGQTDYEVVHSLDNQRVSVSIMTEDFEPCHIDYKAETENKIVISFDITALPVADTKFYVTVMAK